MTCQIYNLDMMDQQELTGHINDGGIIVRYGRPYSDFGCLMWASMDGDEVADEAQRAFDRKWGRSVAYPGYELEEW